MDGDPGKTCFLKTLGCFEAQSPRDSLLSFAVRGCGLFVTRLKAWHVTYTRATGN
jgi:hypothetical protein